MSTEHCKLNELGKLVITRIPAHACVPSYVPCTRSQGNSHVWIAVKARYGTCPLDRGPLGVRTAEVSTEWGF